MDVSGAIAAISYVDRDFGSIHTGKPSAPVALCSAINAGGISIAQSEVVGANKCVFVSSYAFMEKHKEVIPVGSQITIVGEGDILCLAHRYVEYV